MDDFNSILVDLHEFIDLGIVMQFIFILLILLLAFFPAGLLRLEIDPI